MSSRSSRAVFVNLFIATLLVIAPPASAQSADENEQGWDSQDVRSLVEREMAEFDIPGLAIVIVDEGEVALLEGFGFADRESGDRVDPVDTVFRIASVSKPLTALAVHRLVSDGLLDLEADVNDYLDFTIEERDGTLVNTGALLTHTAGFEDRAIGVLTFEADEVTPLGDWLPSNVPARFASTGEAHSYSNHGYALAGYIVERVSGVDFREFTRAELFEPLGMTSTTFEQEVPEGAAVGYSGKIGNREAADPTFIHPFPAGGAFTTASDMGALLLALLGDSSDVIDSQMRAALFEPDYRPHPEVPGRTGGFKEISIGGTRVIGHGGDIGTFAAQIQLVPDQNVGFFFAYNAVDLEFSDALATGLLDLLIEADPGPEPAFVDLDPDILGEYAGSYRWTKFGRSQADKILALTPPYNMFVSAGDDGTLTVTILGVEEEWVYRPIDELAFAKVSGGKIVVGEFLVDLGERIAFSRNSDGEVAYLHLALQTLAAEKTPIYLMGVVQISLIGSIALLFIIALVAWPIGAWVRRRRSESLATGARRVRLLFLVQTGLVVGALVLFFVGIGGAVQFGMPPIAAVSIAMFTIAGVVGLALLPAAVVSWNRGWLSIGERITLSILALTGPIVLWWTIYWNLFGFQW